MIWYLTFTGMFALYQLDVAVYALIALIAKLREIIWPEPGNPWHSRWHKPIFVEPAVCDDKGFQLSAMAAAALEKSSKTAAGSPAAITATWHISTQARVSMSSMRSSTTGSSTASAASGSDCSGSAASGSQPGTPPAADLSPQSALQRLFAQLPSQSQLATVYSEQIPSSPEAATTPHVSAKGLRLRAGGSDDGDKGASTAPGHVGYTIHASSPASRPGANWWASVPEAELQSYSRSQPQLTEVPPPSSAVMTGQGCLLPASLVSQYNYFPMVLVQLPMYNEEAHCEVVIERACNIIW